MASDIKLLDLDDLKLGGGKSEFAYCLMGKKNERSVQTLRVPERNESKNVIVTDLKFRHNELYDRFGRIEPRVLIDFVSDVRSKVEANPGARLEMDIPWGDNTVRRMAITTKRFGATWPNYELHLDLL